MDISTNSSFTLLYLALSLLNSNLTGHLLAGRSHSAYVTGIGSGPIPDGIVSVPVPPAGAPELPPSSEPSIVPAEPPSEPVPLPPSLLLSVPPPVPFPLSVPVPPIH